MGYGKPSRRGLTAWSLLTWLAALALLVWAAVRIVPLYYQYWTVQTILDTHVRQAEAYDTTVALHRAVRTSLQSKGAGEVVPEGAIEVTRTEAGYRIVVDYERGVPLTDRVRLVYDFRAEAASGG